MSLRLANELHKSAQKRLWQERWFAHPVDVTPKVRRRSGLGGGGGYSDDEESTPPQSPHAMGYFSFVCNSWLSLRTDKARHVQRDLPFLTNDDRETHPVAAANALHIIPVVSAVLYLVTAAVVMADQFGNSPFIGSWLALWLVLVIAQVVEMVLYAVLYYGGRAPYMYSWRQTMELQSLMLLVIVVQGAWALSLMIWYFRFQGGIIDRTPDGPQFERYITNAFINVLGVAAAPAVFSQLWRSLVRVHYAERQYPFLMNDMNHDKMVPWMIGNPFSEIRFFTSNKRYSAAMKNMAIDLPLMLCFVTFFGVVSLSGFVAWLELVGVRFITPRTFCYTYGAVGVILLGVSVVAMMAYRFKTSQMVSWRHRTEVFRLGAVQLVLWIIAASALLGWAEGVSPDQGRTRPAVQQSAAFVLYQVALAATAIVAVLSTDVVFRLITVLYHTEASVEMVPALFEDGQVRGKLVYNS